MASKPTLPTLVNTGNVQAQLTTINNGYRQIENEFEKMLSREDNSLPNHMLDALDMDGNKVINVLDGTEGADAVNKSQLDTKENSLGTPTEDGMFLASLTNGYRYWAKGASGGTASPPVTLFDHIDFNTASASAGAVGRLVWNDTDGTLNLGVKGGNVTLQVGQEQLIRVVNKTNADFLEANYLCVKLTGAQGQRPKVELAIADSREGHADTIGLVTERINKNQEGFVTTSGFVRGINTTGSLQGESWEDGDIVYLSPTTAGKLTKTAPLHRVRVGFVVYAHVNNGIIYVDVDEGSELQGQHDVSITSPTNNQVLQYESASGLWKNKTLSTGGTVTSVSGTGSYGGLTLTGTVTTSGNITLGGTPTGTWPISVSGNAATVTDGVYTTGNQTIAGNKTFSGTTALAAGSTIDGLVVGYRDVPVTISNTAKTFALTDAGKAFGKDNGTAYTYTIPANGTVAFPIGTVITVFNNNATNNITVAITTDTLRLAGTTTTGSRTVAPFALCTLFKVSSTVWMASGAGVT